MNKPRQIVWRCGLCMEHGPGVAESVAVAAAQYEKAGWTWKGAGTPVQMWCCPGCTRDGDSPAKQERRMRAILAVVC